MRHIIIAMVATLCVQTVCAQSADDLWSLYEQLDEAIAHVDDYVAAHSRQVYRLKDRLRSTSDSLERFRLEMTISESYRKTMNDSAIHYIDHCITLAEGLGDRIRVDECCIQLAWQCTEAGMYHEAMDILHGIDATQITDPRNLKQYNSTLAHLYTEMGYYCKVPRVQLAYYAQGDKYRQLIDTTVCSRDEALQINEIACFNAGDAKGALRYSDMRLEQVKDGSHEFAIVAFYRYLDYQLSGDSLQARYWVTQSALSDVTNAVMDQGAMWELANLLMADGDMDRAYRYIHFAWQCASRFNTVKRNNQISPVLTAISDNYEASLKRANRLLLALVIVSTLLAALFSAILFYSNSQRKKLSRARNELSASNTQLAQLNSQLSDLNNQMRQTNLKLNESNRVKDEYVGRFIHLCSFYIDRLDEMRKRINKMVKSRDLDALNKFTEGNELREHNLTELYGIATLLDDTSFGDLPSFRSRYAGQDGDIDGLKFYNAMKSSRSYDSASRTAAASPSSCIIRSTPSIIIGPRSRTGPSATATLLNCELRPSACKPPSWHRVKACCSPSSCSAMSLYI